MRLRSNGSNVGPTSLLQMLIREMGKGEKDTIEDWGDGEWRRAAEKIENRSKESL